jgi:5-methylcytosine-specific restriction endonuclease McrA
LILRVKRAVYKDEEELNSLKSYVSNMEAAIEYRRNGPTRIAIPDDVKLAAWTRDGGACMRCGSKEQLHFDHVIPVAKGGSNDLQNIQILCAPCNLKKSDKIVS